MQHPALPLDLSLALYPAFLSHLRAGAHALLSPPHDSSIPAPHMHTHHAAHHIVYTGRRLSPPLTISTCSSNSTPRETAA
ncbi:MAG: hypothetical protein WDW36_005770 [Sanguina aurantia]